MTLPGEQLLGTITTGGTALSPTTTTSANTAPVTASAIAGGESPLPFSLTTGWYVFFGLGAGLLLSGTQLAPIALGLLTTALLYQITQLVEGK